MAELFAWMAIVGILVVIGVGLWCLRNCEEKARKYLVLDTRVFLAALALHFGGPIVLGFFGLAWRNLPGMILWMILVGSLLIWIVLALCCFVPQTNEIGWVNQGIVVFFAGVTLLGVLWVGLIVLTFGYLHEERIVEYESQSLLEVDMSWLHPTYYYYEYRGSLFHGSELIYREQGQIDRMK